MADKYNVEAYADPTPFAALGAIEIEIEQARAYRPVAYICSPFAGDVKANVSKARKYCRFAAAEGYIPLAPHLLFPQFLNDGNPVERELGMHFGNVLMGICKELWVFGAEVSKGMDREIRRARRKGLRIRWFTLEFKEEKK